MPSSLDTIPVDVLEHIAFLATTSSPFVQPKEIHTLLLTCRSIYAALSIHSCPQLYARLFQSEFDFDPSRRFENGLTDSALTAELVQRHRLLRRVRTRDLSEAGLLQDLWTALWMILEHSSLNTPQLFNVGFNKFILDVMCTLLQDIDSHYKEETRLSLWLTALTLTTGDARSKSEETRDRILSLLRPFALQIFNQGPGIIPHPAVIVARDTALGPKEEAPSIFHYSRMKIGTCPDPSYPAIILTFALKEVDVLQAPPHLPIDRATAVATQRSGPTVQDYDVISTFRTPLFADCDPCKKKRHQVAEHFLGTSDSAPGSRNSSPLEAVWEGMYMVAPVAANHGHSSSSSTTCEDQDYLCRTPMQCCIDPSHRHRSRFTKQSKVWSIKPYEESELVANLFEQLEDGGVDTPLGHDACVFEGETSEEHEQAWGGFRFIGKTTADGSIILKRTPKDSMNLGSNIWVFEGKLCYGSAFVGRWRSSEIGIAGGISGVFSLRKRPKDS